MTFATALVMFALYSLDDVALLVAFVAWRVIRRFRRRDRPLTAALLAGEPERRIAVRVPAWDESDVIQRMLRAMLDRYDYRNDRVFVGVYPNDPATRQEVESVAADDPRVACIVVARPGPTIRGVITGRRGTDHAKSGLSAAGASARRGIGTQALDSRLRSGLWAHRVPRYQ